jgi:hypothetical protein
LLSSSIIGGTNTLSAAIRLTNFDNFGLAGVDGLQARDMISIIGGPGRFLRQF